MNISTTSWPIPIKFYLKHHLGGGKAALGFGPDRIGTLVSEGFFFSSIEFRVVNFEFRVEDFEFRVVNFEFRVKNFEFRV